MNPLLFYQPIGKTLNSNHGECNEKPPYLSQEQFTDKESCEKGCEVVAQCKTFFYWLLVDQFNVNV